MSTVSHDAPVPVPPLAHANVWVAFYDAINQHGLEKAHVPTIPAVVSSQGRIPPAVSRYINHAFAAGTRDARATLPLPKPSEFPVPDHDTEDVATCVLERYYQQGYSYVSLLGPPPSPTATAAAATAAAPAVAVPPMMPITHEPKMKINLPEEFSGDRNKYDKFRTQLILCFAANPAQFEDDRAKIVFAASFLRGPAADWWVPKIKAISTTNGITTMTMAYTTFEEFMKALRAAFDDPDAVTTFAYDLQRLRQGKKTVSEYYAKFSPCLHASIGMRQPLSTISNKVLTMTFGKALSTTHATKRPWRVSSPRPSGSTLVCGP